MTSTTVQYINPNHDSKETKDSQKDIKVFYLKATIVILTLALATVSGILIWKLLANDFEQKAKAVTDENTKQESSDPQTKNEKKILECPQISKKKLLPYTLPRGVQQTFKELKEILKAEITKKTLVSVSCTAVYRDEQLWNAGYGILDKSTFPRKSPNKDTLYRTGSLVKLLTVLVTLKLLNEKKLDCLDDPLQKYLPQFSIKNPFNKDIITIRQILSHTSGLPREVPCGPSFSSKKGNICAVNTSYVFENLKNEKLKFAPGASVGYSNLGYAVLAHTLFKTFGWRYESWEKWMLHEVLNPLGMTSTVLNSNSFHPNVAQNYQTTGILSPTVDWGWSSPSFQMKSSANDLAKLMLAILNPGLSYIDEKIIRDMFKPEFVFPDLHTMFSAGWQIRYHNSIRIIKKAGAVPGSSAAIILMPEKRFGFVILGTGQEIVPKLAEEISIKLSKSFSINVISNSVEVSLPPTTGRYTGIYTLKNNWSDKVRATISAEKLTGRLMLKQNPGYPSYVYLSYVNEHILQIVYPDGLSCEVYALGQDKEKIKFKHTDNKGRFKQFTIGSFVFHRIH